MRAPDDVTGVILVGGKSSRMGRDKAFPSLEGILFIDKVLSTLRSSFRSIVLVGDRPERFDKYGLTVYPDIFPGNSLRTDTKPRGGGNYRIRDFYPKVRVRFVPPEEIAGIDDNEGAFLNVNTIEEYEAILVRKKRDV
jgi:molybdopterin-guanine dinucleotide biosynthesis protein A